MFEKIVFKKSCVLKNYVRKWSLVPKIGNRQNYFGYLKKKCKGVHELRIKLVTYYVTYRFSTHED